MPPTRTSATPGFSPHRSPSLSSIPFKFRRKSLSEDELPPPDRALLFPSSPSRSPSLSMSMSSSPPSSPSAIATSPSRPNYNDTAAIRQPSSPLHPPVQHTYGYAHSYPRARSHHSGYGYDLYSAEYPLKPFAPTSHPYGVVPPPSTSSGRSVYSLSSIEYDGSDLFHSSASNSGFHHDDDIEDTFGFALDMDDILGRSSPSRRVSFTTSSERDRPFVRPPAPPPMKPRAQTRAKKAPASTSVPVATPAPPENPRAMTVETDGSSTSIVRVSALPQEMPPRPSTPTRPRTRLASPVVRAPAVAEDVDLDALPPSSPIASPLSSPLSSPVKSREQLLREQHTDGSLPPSSPIPIPRSPVREAEGDMDSLEFDLVPSPPSPTLDALRITSRIAVRALLNPSPDPVVVPATLESAAEQAYQTVRDSSAKVETDGDVTPLVLSEVETSRVQAVMEEVTEDISVLTNTADVPSASCVPSRVLSRASTPDCSALPDIPSSPLSSPPRSVADEHDVAVDLDIEVDIEVTEEHIELPAPAASRETSSTRDTSPQQDKVIHVPPHKTVKRRAIGQEPMRTYRR
ncbi:hypothetical protein BD413DRAFT_219013 [Trametes elegans]|nr:hypothetical protein BD413DRAFT_219013 [Trametes elegans]